VTLEVLGQSGECAEVSGNVTRGKEVDSPVGCVQDTGRILLKVYGRWGGLRKEAFRQGEARARRRAALKIIDHSPLYANPSNAKQSKSKHPPKSSKTPAQNLYSSPFFRRPLPFFGFFSSSLLSLPTSTFSFRFLPSPPAPSCASLILPTISFRKSN